MDDAIKKALNTKGWFHDELLKRVKPLVEMSRNYMCRYYPIWEAVDWILRTDRLADEADHKAVKRKEPPKQVLPFTYAQTQTFIAFNVMLFTQRDLFFEISDDNDDKTPTDQQTSNPRQAEDDAESLLRKDLVKSKFTRILYQCFLDICRSGFCVIKSRWHEESVTEQVQSEGNTSTDLFGNEVENPPTTQEKTSFKKQRNVLMNVSPFRFLPDVRFPFSRLQEGEFCASEEEYSLPRLKQMQADGLIVNVDEIQPLKPEALEHRRLLGYNSQNVNPLVGGVTEGEGRGTTVITEIQVWITPKDLELMGEEHPLGTSDRPQLYVIWYANDMTIVKCEPMNYEHNQFTYDIGELNCDQLRVVNESLAEIVDGLQTTASWLINSRITSVRKIIDNRLIVDPSGIEISDLQERKPVIRLKPGMGRGGVDNFIKQLELQDVTTGHINDVQTLWSFMQICTGINDNALGQYNGGRRSAAEARTVNAGAASRLKTVAQVLWETLFIPLGEKMLENLQAYLTVEEFGRHVGLDEDDPELQERYEEFCEAEPNFEFFDGTAPSEKGYIAQSMQELLLGLLSNPQAAMLLNQEPFRSMIVEVCDLRGIRNPNRFLPAVQPTPEAVQPTVLPNASPSPKPAVAGGAPPGAPPAISAVA